MSESLPILVTGGAGFIGSNFVLEWLRSEAGPIINLDKLTYAGNRANLSSIEHDARHIFVRGDICDAELVASILREHRPRAIVHFAAESHVDRSIVGPEEFLRTNIDGTSTLLKAAKEYIASEAAPEGFRFLHISTDEVFGSLEPEGSPFTETTAYAPSSPYAASKAGSDHLVRAWQHTYGFPALVIHCSNNYGPYQFPEKLIPLMITHALEGQPLPLYGDGLQMRDWLYVRDFCAAIRAVLERGRIGETYNVGSHSQRTNLEVVKALCALLDELAPESRFRPHAQLIKFVADRPGHDRRYAIDARKIERELGWKPQENFETGLRKTVAWYLEHRGWVQGVTSGAYRLWMSKNYEGRAEVKGRTS